MADFLKAYAITNAHEGGYINDKADRGGETYKGVARNFHPSWPGWKIVDATKREKQFPQNLERLPELQKMVESFYRETFWNALRGDEIQNQHIANELFDTAVNMGTGVAVRMVQEALNLSNRDQKDYPDIPVDGVMGKKTVFFINNHTNPELLLKALNVFQGHRYIEICRKDSGQERFFIGWFKRVSL